MTTQYANRPATAEAATGQETASHLTTTSAETGTAYQPAAWRTWPEVEITVNPDLPADPCGYCGYLDRPTTTRVHAPIWFGYRDVCDVCAPEVVQMGVDLNPETTQVETAS